MGCTEGTLCCVSRSTSTDMSSRVQTDTCTRKTQERERRREKREIENVDLIWRSKKMLMDRVTHTKDRVCVYRASPLAAPATVTVCVYTHAQLGGESALGYISHCFGQEKKKPKEDGRQTVYCVSISRWIYRAASGRRGAHTSLVGSAAVVCRRSWPTIRRWLRSAQLMWTMNPPCHMLVSLAQHLGNRKLFLICIFVDSKIGRTYDKHILSAQTRGRRQAIYLARTAFFKRKMCCCESKMWVTIYVFPTLARSSALIAVGLHLWSTSQFQLSTC